MRVNAYEGFDKWFASEYAPLVNSLCYLGGDVEAARDAAAEAFARALSHWERVSSMTSRTGWLYRVAINVERRRRRRHVTERELVSELRDRGPIDIQAPALELWDAVAGLPPQERLMVILYYVGDLPQGDVAAIAGVRRGTVASTLAQARSRLAAVLSEVDERKEVLQ